MNNNNNIFDNSWRKKFKKNWKEFKFNEEKIKEYLLKKPIFYLFEELSKQSNIPYNDIKEGISFFMIDEEKENEINFLKNNDSVLIEIYRDNEFGSSRKVYINHFSDSCFIEESLYESLFTIISELEISDIFNFSK